MTKLMLKTSFRTIATTLLAVSLAVSCKPSVSKNSLRGGGKGKSSLYDTSKLAVGEGRVLLDNPIILSGKTTFSADNDLSTILSAPVYITGNNFLQSSANCYGVPYCFVVLEEKTSVAALQTTNGKWGYSPDTEEFLQVNAYYHLNEIFKSFFNSIKSSTAMVFDAFGIQRYDSALPSNLIVSSETYRLNMSTPVQTITACDAENNAFYEAANRIICLGFTKTPTVPLRWAQDSTIIYHELGHFFQDMQLNMRNPASVVVKPNLGNIKGYSEAAAIGEGLSDYYSYFMNGRTHFAEWAAGRYLGASRPMSEDDPLHASGISTDPDERLSYPDFISYDPNHAGIPVEEIHSAGLIASHFLVALTEDLQTKCSLSNEVARNHVMHLVTETLAELGDMTSVGTNAGVAGKVNLSATYSKLWFDVVNPINYRSFIQTLAKNIVINLGNSGLNSCGTTYYKKDDLEQLLDSYGLLLFKTYNQHRNLADGVTKVNTPVTATNRKKSVLVPKSALIFDPSPDASVAFVFDDQKLIRSALAEFLKVDSSIKISDQIKDDLPYNNGNSKISPGEVVAIALNLYNNSNSTMGGIQILANDWDHADTTAGTSKGRPCQFPSSMSNDTWPLESEGGSTAPNCSTVAASASDFAPICFIQANEASSTRWVSQSEFRQKLALDNNFCLNPEAGKDQDCFVRAVRGLDLAYYSKLNPKQTWGQTFQNPDPKAPAPDLEFGNLFFLEVSKHIPPGTVIDCRIRVRFTNCEDCYHDSSRANYDFKDVDYNGPKPFKVLHLQIPITD